MFNQKRKLSQEIDKLKNENKSLQQQLIDANTKEDELLEKVTKLHYDLREKEKEISIAKEEASKEKESYISKRKELIERYNNNKLEIENRIRIRSELIEPLKKHCNVEGFYQSMLQGILNNAFKKPPLIEEFNVSARIVSSNSKEVYSVNLFECTCTDYRIRKRPCKHILYLAYLFALLQIEQKSAEPLIKELHDYINNVEKLRSEKKDLESKIYVLKYMFAEEEQEISTKRRQLNEQARKEAENIKSEAIKQKKLVDITYKKLTELNEFTENQLASLIDKKTEIFPEFATMMAELLTYHYTKSADILEKKDHPALTEAKRIRELAKETREIAKEKKILEYKLAYIEKLFPNIIDIFDTDFNSYDNFELETEETTDRTRLFLSPEEYQKLSVTERNQLALDRYIEQRKSKWQIGRDYEMYIGQACEERGYSVQYTGIIKNLEDMGRDLIAIKNTETYIIQCKNWSKEKTIHEKHIFQLYGTVILWKLENPFFDVRGVFVTTTTLSKKAKEVADELDIEVYENVELGEFPRIKCNINRTTGEKIYHLPFDQQYDTAVIEEKNGECYAYTVSEAEEKGFRRALKHFVTK